MKDVQELALGSSDVTVLTPKVISATVEEIRRGNRVVAQFYRENRDLVEQGGTQVEFPKKGSNVVVTLRMSAGQTISPTAMTYDATTIAITKHGVGLSFQGEAIRQVKRDVIRDAIVEAGEAYADAMDTLALEAMFPAVTITGTSTLAADGTLLIGIKSTVGNITANSFIQSSTGATISATGAGTVVAWYIPSTAGARRIASVSTVAGGTMSVKDIYNARADIVGYNYNPNYVIVNPTRLGDILYDPATKLIESYSQSGGPIPLRGELGQIWDMKLIVTNKAPAYGAILVDSTALGYCIERLDLDLKRDEITGLSSDQLYFYGFVERTYGVVNQRAFGALALAGTLAVTVHPTR